MSSPAGEAEMRIRVEREKCQGHAMCSAVAPELFTLDDDGYSDIDVLEVPPGREEDARRGTAACPEGAIFLEP